MTTINGNFREKFSEILEFINGGKGKICEIFKGSKEHKSPLGGNQLLVGKKT